MVKSRKGKISPAALLQDALKRPGLESAIVILQIQGRWITGWSDLSADDLLTGSLRLQQDIMKWKRGG